VREAPSAVFSISKKSPVKMVKGFRDGKAIIPRRSKKRAAHQGDAPH